MSGSPTFVITNAGLKAAATATSSGPYIQITSFQVGSGYGYTPQPTDLGLNGSLLFEGTPTSYQNVSGDTIDILCEIPPNAGPFQFGEIALFLPGNVMFAKAVFPTPQTKFSALGSNVVSSYELHCLLTLAQGTAIFQVSTTVPITLLQVYNWADVYPPNISANPGVPLLQVMEPSEFGDSTLLTNSSSSTWSISSTYARYNQVSDVPTFPVANASTTWIEIAASELHALDLTTIDRRFVVEVTGNYFRSVSSVVTSGSNYRFNLNGTPLQSVPALGSALTIYRDDLARGNAYYSQLLDPLNYDITNLAPNTGTVNTYAGMYKQASNVPKDGQIRVLYVPLATVNTGASTFAVNGGSPFPILGMANMALQGGEMNGAVTMRFSQSLNNEVGAWQITNSTLGPIQIPNALQSQQAITYGQAEALQPPGMVVFTASPMPPPGFLAADGSAISRAVYANLYATLGTTYGAGDGLTTFNVPDLRGVVPRGLDNGRGLDPGRTLGSYQADMYMSHTHPYTDPTHTHYIYAEGGWPYGIVGYGDMGSAATDYDQGYGLASPSVTGITIENSGGTETRGKNIALLGCIKW